MIQKTKPRQPSPIEHLIDVIKRQKFLGRHVQTDILEALEEAEAFCDHIIEDYESRLPEDKLPQYE